LVIDWEESHGCTVFWGHVGDSGSIGQTEVGASWSKELNELSDDTTLSEHGDASKNEISSGGVLWEHTSKFESNDLGQDHGNLLAKHDRFGFDTTDSPSNDTKSIDHGSVRISSDARIWVEDTVSLKDDLGEPLKVDLVNNTVAWWHDGQVVESFLSPLEECESLGISVELKLFVLLLGILSSGNIDLNGVIDDEIDLAKWVDLVWVTTLLLHGSSHGGEIDNSWDTSEILKEDTSWLEWDLHVLLRGVLPVENGLNVGRLDVEIVTVSNSTFEENSDRVWKLLVSGVLKG